jgi:hypothetical protein
MIPTSNQMELDFSPECGYDIQSLQAAITQAEKLVVQYAIQRPEGPQSPEGV